MDYLKYIRGMVGTKRIIMAFVLAAIFNEKGELLLQKRADKKKWGLPGGVLELGETLEKAVIREVKEETAYKIKPTSIIGVYTGSDYYTSYPNGDRTQPVGILFNVKVIGGKTAYKIDAETLELKYFNKNNLPELAGKDFADMIDDAFAGKKAIWH